MSETIEQPILDPEPPPVAPEPTNEAPPESTPEPEPEPEPAPKPDKVERRIANLTRKMADEARAREAAERRAEAAESLLRAHRPDNDETPPQPRQAGPQDIETRAQQLLQERQFTQRLFDIDSKGKTELGADQWEQAKATLTGLGAVNNQAFLQALAETDAPHKIFAALADDTDALMDLMNKSPAAMAAKLGRMDADLSRPTTKPLSAAPTPAARVRASGVVAEPSIYDAPASMSMKEWNKLADNYLPPHLGGKKKAS